MVGAIADWFAVTALFRHPLGLPIPHTALIPTRKDMLARSLQDFVTENFLSEAVIRTRVADAQVSRRVGGWLSEPDHARRVVTEASSLCERAWPGSTTRTSTTWSAPSSCPGLLRNPWPPWPASCSATSWRRERIDGIVDLVLSEADRWLADNELAFSAAIRTRAPWWSPTWLDERVARRLHQEVLAWVARHQRRPEPPCPSRPRRPARAARARPPVRRRDPRERRAAQGPVARAAAGCRDRPLPVARAEPHAADHPRRPRQRADGRALDRLTAFGATSARTTPSSADWTGTPPTSPPSS